MRLRKKPWIETAIQDYQHLVELQDPSPRSGSWLAPFPGKTQLQLEIGCGKGSFINSLAEQNPNVTYVGIESQLGVLYYAVLKAHERQADNLLFVHGDAAKLTEWFDKGEVDQIYLNFSDPWPKNKQAKRRLTHRGFLTVYRQLLKPGGRLLFKTDNQALFAFSLAEFAAANLTIETVCWDLHNSELPNPAMTEYEKKFSSLGQAICFCQVRFE